MPYRFRLETLLNYRLNLEDQEKQRFAREQTILMAHQQRLLEMQAGRAAMINTFEEQKQRPLAAAMFAFFVEAIRTADIVIARQENTIAAQMRVVEQARERLLEKMRDRKVMEQVKARDKERYQQAALHQELKENDEQAVLRFGRVPAAQ